MADELGMNNPVSGGAFETEDSKASTPTKKGGGGMFGGETFPNRRCRSARALACVTASRAPCL